MLTVSEMAQQLNILKECRKLRLPFWVCPRFLFVVMGLATIAAMLFAYFYWKDKVEPDVIVLITSGIAALLVVQTYIIVLAFEKVAELNRLKSEFINIISHQLRTPTTSARWAMDFLSKGERKAGETQTPPPALAEYFDIINQSILRISELVNTLLSVSRLESGRITFKPEVFNLWELVRDIIMEIKPVAEANDIRIFFEEPRAKTLVNLDREQTRFIVKTLLDNAVGYIRGKGEVKVWLEIADAQVKLNVQDTGIGIPESEQKNIFEQFSRASNAALLQPHGVGIALYISREIARKYGGDTTFVSKEGKGSTFSILLPKSSDATNSQG